MSARSPPCGWELSLWLICFLISAGGIALIRYAQLAEIARLSRMSVPETPRTGRAGTRRPSRCGGCLSVLLASLGIVLMLPGVCSAGRSWWRSWGGGVSEPRFDRRDLAVQLPDRRLRASG